MSKEKNLANALATTSTMLAETITSRDQYMEWWTRKNAECDELKSQVIKLRSDLEFAQAELKNVKAALETQKQLATAAAKDESPFKPIDGEQQEA